MFAEEVRDAAGFGWDINKHPSHDLKSLIKKKVSKRQPIMHLYLAHLATRSFCSFCGYSP